MLPFTELLDRIDHETIEQITLLVEEGSEPEVRQEIQAVGLTVVSSEETEDGIMLTIEDN